MIGERHIRIDLLDRVSSTKGLATFPRPFSFDELKVWYDLRQFKVKKVQIWFTPNHRQICLISATKFNSLNFKELPYVRYLLDGGNMTKPQWEVAEAMKNQKEKLQQHDHLQTT